LNLTTDHNGSYVIILSTEFAPLHIDMNGKPRKPLLIACLVITYHQTNLCLVYSA